MSVIMWVKIPNLRVLGLKKMAIYCFVVVGWGKLLAFPLYGLL